MLVSPVPTFGCHQKILTVYHSTFLIRLSPHTNSAPRNGGVPDFWRPPSTGRSQWAKEKIPNIKTCLSSQARITQREAASPTVKPIGFNGTSLGRIPLFFFLPPPVLGLYSSTILWCRNYHRHELIFIFIFTKASDSLGAPFVKVFGKGAVSARASSPTGIAGMRLPKSIKKSRARVGVFSEYFCISECISKPASLWIQQPPHTLPTWRYPSQKSP